MEHKPIQRFLSAVMAFAMLLTLLPAGVFAADGESLVTHTLDTTVDLTAFAQGERANGDTEVVNEYFTIHYSAKNKVDSSSKAFSDGYTATQRLSFGGKTVTDSWINSVEFTTAQAATVKIWWVAGGDGRQFAIFGSDGTILTQTSETSIKNGLYISELTVSAAGTYYLGLPTDSNYLFKLEVTEGTAAEPEVTEPSSEPATEPSSEPPTEPSEPAAQPDPSKIDVWDFGFDTLDESKYNNLLTVEKANASFYANGVVAAAGTVNSGNTIGDWSIDGGDFAFAGGGKTNHRLRVNTAIEGLTAHSSGKYMKDAETGITYNGFIYSNSGSNTGVQIQVKAQAGDILTFVYGAGNAGSTTAVFERPDGTTVEKVFENGGDKSAYVSTFYASEAGVYKFYVTNNKLQVARVYRQHTSEVTATGTVTAPAELTGYSLVFTCNESGAVVKAPVENGTYTATLREGYSYAVTLENANGYVINQGKSLAIEAGAASAALDVDIIAVDLVTVSGSITGLSDEALAKLSLSFTADALYIPEITVNGAAYTAVLERNVSYAVAIEGINDYALTSAATVSYDADTTADITLEAKPTYAITIAPEGCTLADLAQATFTFTNLEEEGYVYTFTGPDAIALRDGTYSVKVTGFGVQKLTSNLHVNGAPVTKTVGFETDIRVWDFSDPNFAGTSPYNGLSWSNASKNKTYLLSNAGTISVPVPGSCQIRISACYTYSFESDTADSQDKKTGSTSQIDTYILTYTGDVGTATINVLDQSYITKIEVLEVVAYKETVTVGASGCDYTTINAALDAIRAMERPNNETVTVSIQPGNYEEMLVIDVPNVHLVNASANPSLALTDGGVGIDANAVRITHYYGHGYDYYSMGADCKWDPELLQVNKENGYASHTNPGSGTTRGSYWNATVVILASGFSAEGIIFENSFNQYVSQKASEDIIIPNSGAKEGSTPRAELPKGSTAVQDKKYVERAAALAIGDNLSGIYFENCKFVGRQDTLYGGKGTKAAFYDCSVYGACDYIFGGMTAVFAKCDLVFNTSEDGNDVGYITAAQTPAGAKGLLMYNCTVTSTVPGVDTASEYPSKPGYFGRPWAADTGEAVFYNTVIDATCEHWYDISASLIRPEGWLSTLSGQSPLCGEFGTYEYAKDVDNSAERVSWAGKPEEAGITVEAFLGSWDAFAGKDMTIVIPTEKVDNAPAEEEAPSATQSLDITADLTAFAQGAKADGDTERFHDYFTVMYSAKNKVDGSNKTFEDGYAATQRLNFGGKTDPAKGMINSVKFTTKYAGTLKIWWVSGGDGRDFALYSADGTVLVETTDTSVKNDLYISELDIPAGGTYYLGVPDGSNYLFKMEVTEFLPEVFVLDATADLTAFAQGAKADGDTERFHDYFTVMYSAKNKVDGSNKTFEDGYAATQRLNFGGKTDPANGMINSVKFTAKRAGTVKIWWVSGGDGRNFALYSADGTVLAKTTDTSVKNDLYISELTIPEAGTYYLGVPDGSNYLFKVEVTENGGAVAEPERPAWATVAAPAITGATADGKTITVTVTGLVGTDGADELQVVMYDAQGNEITSKRSIAEVGEHTLTFTGSDSGKYTFKASLIREGEEAKTSEAYELDFVLPLEAPILSSATSIGRGAVSLVWNAAKEAVSYNVYVDGELAGNTAELTYIVSGLTVGTQYSFIVEAVRGEDKALSEAMSATVTENAQAVWSFLRYGPSTNDTNNGYTGSINEQGSVTVYSTGGKGKIQPKDSDGLAYYYTAIPADKNFTLRATVTVDSWKYSNGQEGFGLLAMDSLPEHGAASHWTNQYMAMLGKVEYFYDFAQQKVVPEANDNTVKYSMKLGLGVLPKLGITPENYDKVIGMDSATILQVATGITYPLDLTAAEQGLAKADYNIVGNVENPDATPTTIAEKTTFILEIQKNNTGYFITYYAEDGTVIGQQKNYDPAALQQLDTENVYVGFFASRNATATFSDVTLTTIDPSEDAPAEEKPVTYITPSCLVASPMVANDPNYTLSLNANVAGTAIIRVDGTVVKEAAVSGKERCDIPMTLEPGTTKFAIEFRPDPNQDLGEDVKLQNTDPVITSIAVTYETGYAQQENLYVAPNGKSTAHGYYHDPMDIYTAVSVVQPGQTIVLLEGTYNLTRNVFIARGIDGTAEEPIRLIADPEAETRPVLDFSGAAGVEGITLVGSHWYLKGFDVTHTPNGKAGIHVAGHYNTLDLVNAYDNGGTGIQISRYQGSDLKSEWPSNNLIRNCTAYNNADSGYEDADGFGAKLTIGEGNVFDGCIAYHNADDGWDLYAKVETGPIGSVTIRNCVAYENGYVEKDGTLVNAGNGNGFKMGGSNISGGHKLINSYAFFNKAKGFDSNSCPDIIVENSIAYNNGSYNVAFYTNIAQNTAFSGTGIISFKDAYQDKADNLKPRGTQAEGDAKIWNDTNYYWDGSKSANAAGATVTADWFVSLEFKGITRNADGTVNMQGFLELTDKAAANAGARPDGEASKDQTVTWDNPFTDVGENDRFKEAVLWAYYNDIVVGKSATVFGLNDNITRGQFVMMLWKAKGRPEPEPCDQLFTDVAPGDRFYKAVTWAAQQGIVAGKLDGSFGLNDECTRRHMAAFLYRFAGRPEVGEVENPFSDVQVDKTYYPAIMWAASNGIIRGYDGDRAGTFGGLDTCKRSHAVMIIYRYLTQVAK